jgi:diguanylate cyclase (GGDEF)-like protein
MRQRAGQGKTALARLRAFASPQENPGREAATLAERERLRRAHMLSGMNTLSLPLNVGLALCCLYPRPLVSLLAGLALSTIFQVASILPCRRGYVRSAAWLYLFGMIAGCTVALFGLPHSLLLASLLLYSFYVLPVVYANLLLSRRSSAVVTLTCVLVIVLHVVQHASLYEAPNVLGGISSFVIGAVPVSIIILLSLRTGFVTATLENAIAQADERAVEIARLYADLQDSHEALEARNDEVDAQAEELTTLNKELIAMQARLEAGNQHLVRMNQTLEQQAIQDAMTGLPNHRMFQRSVRARIEQAVRQRHPLSLLMLDVDDFKRYNDTFGHPAGDEVLRLVGGLLIGAVRADDTVARYGGEEFTVILPYADLACATAVAERIRACIAVYDFPHDHVTVSIGVAELDHENPDAGELIRAADSALYEAKRMGRNRVSFTAAGSIPIENYLEDSEPKLRLLKPSDLTMLDTDSFGGIEGLTQEPPGMILAVLLAALDLRDAETQGHSLRVARYSLLLARVLNRIYERTRAADAPRRCMLPYNQRELALGALLHDIGKIRIPDRILRKPGPLTDDEWALMRRHTIVGAELVCGFPQLAPALPVVRHHHERWDGRGYPDGLSGEMIPLTARIFAVCDALDAMMSERPYRNALPFAAARDEIVRNTGTQFDPEVVEAFQEVSETEWMDLRMGTGSTEDLRAAA